MDKRREEILNTAFDQNDFKKFVALVGDTIFADDDCYVFLSNAEGKEADKFFQHLVPQMGQETKETLFLHLAHTSVTGCALMINHFDFSTEKAFIIAKAFDFQPVIDMLFEKYNYTEKNIPLSKLKSEIKLVQKTREYEMLHEEKTYLLEYDLELFNFLACEEFEKFQKRFKLQSKHMSRKEIDMLLKASCGGFHRVKNDGSDSLDGIIKLFVRRASQEAKNEAIVMCANKPYISGIKILLENGADIHTHNDAVFKKAKSWEYKNLQEFLSQF